MSSSRNEDKNKFKDQVTKKLIKLGTKGSLSLVFIQDKFIANQNNKVKSFAYRGLKEMFSPEKSCKKKLRKGREGKGMLIIH